MQQYHSFSKQFGLHQEKQEREVPLMLESGASKEERERERFREGKSRVNVKVNKLSLCPNIKDCQREKMEKEQKGKVT